MPAGPRSKRRPERNLQKNDEDNDVDDENYEDKQTDDEKRRVRKTLREMYEKLQQNREKFTSETDSEEFNHIMNEANEILKEVKGTQEAHEDAKMFRLLCQLVREMSEDTNTNEKKFHVDEYAANIGRFVNANTDRGNNVRITRRQLVSLGQKN